MEEKSKNKNVENLSFICCCLFCFLFSKACAIVCKRSVCFCWMAVKLVVCVAKCIDQISHHKNSLKIVLKIKIRQPKKNTNYTKFISLLLKCTVCENVVKPERKQK